MQRCGTCRFFKPWLASYKTKVGDGMHERLRYRGRIRLSLFGSCRAPVPACVKATAIGGTDWALLIDRVSAFKHPRCKSWKAKS